MKAILEFDLPAEKSGHLAAAKAVDMARALQDMSDEMYRHDDGRLESLDRGVFDAILNRYDINLDELYSLSD